MKRLLAFLTLIYFLTPVVSHAAPAKKAVMLNGIDISAAIDFYSTQVSVLTSSVNIYNWSPNSIDDDSASSQRAQLWSKTFWTEYGQGTGSGNMYGRGLYAALDPVATRSYGGGAATGWLLLEMKLPIGFKFLDVNAYGIVVPANVQSILSSFNCPSIDSAFQGGGMSVNANCHSLIKALFQDNIKIDAISYNYNSTQFKICSQNQSYNTSRAFVIARSNWIKPELINYYTAKTTKDVAARTMIQSLFLPPPMSKEDIAALQSKVVSDYLALHSDSTYQGTQSNCYGNICNVIAIFCTTDKVCDFQSYSIQNEVTTLMTAAEFSQTAGYGLKSLLWADLEGKEKAKAKIQDDWVMAHRLGCSGTLQVKALSN